MATTQRHEKTTHGNDAEPDLKSPVGSVQTLDAPQNQMLQRKLQARHLSMIAIGTPSRNAGHCHAQGRGRALCHISFGSRRLQVVVLEPVLSSVPALRLCKVDLQAPLSGIGASLTTIYSIKPLKCLCQSLIVGSIISSVIGFVCWTVMVISETFLFLKLAELAQNAVCRALSVKCRLSHLIRAVLRATQPGSWILLLGSLQDGTICSKWVVKHDVPTYFR